MEVLSCKRVPTVGSRVLMPLFHLDVHASMDIQEVSVSSTVCEDNAFPLNSIKENRARFEPIFVSIERIRTVVKDHSCSKGQYAGFHGPVVFLDMGTGRKG